MNPDKEKGSWGFVIFCTLVATLGGLLFGYDTGVISGTTEFLQNYFSLNELQLGWICSSALIGCIFGSVSSGWFSDKFGRRRMLIVCAVLFAVSAVWSAMPRSASDLVIARIIGGLAVGAASLLSPLYIAEISPEKYRGRLVTLNQFAIVFGFVVVYYVNSRIANVGDEAWNINQGWRWMFGSETIPAAILFLMLFMVPESPRWLLKQGREKEGLGVLIRIGGRAHAETELRAIEDTLEETTGRFVDLIKKRYIRVLIVGMGLAFFGQVTGINVIMYYAPRIFKESGLDTAIAIHQTLLIGIVQFVFTIGCYWLVDRCGRKVCLLSAAVGMGLSMLLLGFAFRAGDAEGPWVLVWVLSYVASFALGMGALPWVLMSEIYPTRLRGRAMSIAVVCVWLTNYFVSLLFPWMLKTMGENVFWFYATMCIFAFLFILGVVPETKGKTLEQIEHELMPSE